MSRRARRRQSAGTVGDKAVTSGSCGLDSSAPLGTLIFLVILFFAWALSFAFKYLNSLSPFPLEVAKLFSEFEIGLFYADVILSGVVLLVGVLRFIWHVIRERD